MRRWAAETRFWRTYLICILVCRARDSLAGSVQQCAHEVASIMESSPPIRVGHREGVRVPLRHVSFCNSFFCTSLAVRYRSLLPQCLRSRFAIAVLREHSLKSPTPARACCGLPTLAAAKIPTATANPTVSAGAVSFVPHSLGRSSDKRRPLRACQSVSMTSHTKPNYGGGDLGEGSIGRCGYVNKRMLNQTGPHFRCRRSWTDPRQRT